MPPAENASPHPGPGELRARTAELAEAEARYHATIDEPAASEGERIEAAKNLDRAAPVLDEMSGPQAGGKGTSEREAVAALAAQLEELRQQLDEARRDAAAAKATVAQWNARLEQEGVGATLMMRRDFKKLAEKVDGLTTTLADTLDRGKLKTPAAPRWDDLDQEQEAAQLATLREWVSGFLRGQYPEYTLPGCWEAHRTALWELGNLRAEWQRVYADPRGVDLEAALWFHERWLPGAVSRLNRAINSDGAIGCHVHGLSSQPYGSRTVSR
jgi:hypothetical protein